MELFKNILIPVEDAENDEVAVQKALEIYEPGATNFYLLFIVRRKGLANFLNVEKTNIVADDNITIKEKALAEEKLREIKNMVTAKAPECIIITKVIFYNHIFSYVLTDYISQNSIDLIIVFTKKIRHFFSFLTEIDYNKIAKQCGCVVMSVTYGCLKHPIKSILLPVNSFVPERKIKIAIAFAKKYNGHIHLVTFLEGSDSESKKKIDIFYATYKLLKQCGYTPQYKILTGDDSEEMLMQYAHKVNADLVLLNPRKNNFISNFINKPITDLYPLSALHVMMLQPNEKV